MINARAMHGASEDPVSISYPVGWWAGGLVVAVSHGNEGCTCVCSETVIIPRQEQKHCSQNRCCCVAQLQW